MQHAQKPSNVLIFTSKPYRIGNFFTKCSNSVSVVNF